MTAIVANIDVWLTLRRGFPIPGGSYGIRTSFQAHTVVNAGATLEQYFITL